MESLPLGSVSVLIVHSPECGLAIWQRIRWLFSQKTTTRLDLATAQRSTFDDLLVAAFAPA